MTTQLLTICLTLTSGLLAAQDVNQMKWEEANESMWVRLGDEVVVTATGPNEEGVREIQFVSCPGTKQKITVFTDRTADAKGFKHQVSIPKDFPFQVQIETGEREGSLLVSVFLKDGNHRRFFTTPEKNLIGVSD